VKTRTKFWNAGRLLVSASVVVISAWIVASCNGKVSSDSTSHDGGVAPCAPMHVQDSGEDCFTVSGYGFDGAECQPIICGCVGSDCHDLYDTQKECEAAFSACSEFAGSTRSADPCAPMHVQGGGDDCASVTGYGFDGAECQPIICGCVGSDCHDLYDTQKECEAAFSDCSK
jgi:hypothetical protein